MQQNHFFLNEGDFIVMSKDVTVEGDKVTALCEGAKVEIYDELHFSSVLIFKDGEWVEENA